MRQCSFNGKGFGNILIDYSPFDSYFKAFYNRGVKVAQIGYKEVCQNRHLSIHL